MDQAHVETSTRYASSINQKINRGALRKWIRLSIVLSIFASDALLLIVAANAAAFLRFGAFVETHLWNLLVVIAPTYLIVAAGLRAYSLRVICNPIASFGRAFGALIIAAGLTFTAAFAFKVGASYSRLEIGYIFTSAAFLFAISRMPFALAIRRSDVLQLKAALLTDDLFYALPRGMEGANLARSVIDVNRLGWSPAKDDPNFLNMLFEQLRPFDRVILVFEQELSRNAWADVMRRTGLQAEVLDPTISAMLPVAVSRLADQATLVISRGPLSLRERALKRALDLGLTLAAMPVVLPVACLVAIAIKLDSRGSVLFAQTRVGRNNHHFHCYKFRTMSANSTDSKGDRSTMRDDDRITRVGRFLRKSSLDELPQLWNVLRGEMSLVGPRPHALGSRAEGALFWEADQSYWLRHAVKPGVTGLAQVRGYRGATHAKRDLELRVASDLEYITRWSLWLDINILLRTAAVVVHHNAY